VLSHSRTVHRISLHHYLLHHTPSQVSNTHLQSCPPSPFPRSSWPAPPAASATTCTCANTGSRTRTRHKACRTLRTATPPAADTRHTPLAQPRSVVRVILPPLPSRESWRTCGLIESWKQVRPRTTRVVQWMDTRVRIRSISRRTFRVSRARYVGSIDGWGVCVCVSRGANRNIARLAGEVQRDPVQQSQGQINESRWTGSSEWTRRHA
jgi:hypothetical protein